MKWQDDKLQKYLSDRTDAMPSLRLEFELNVKLFHDRATKIQSENYTVPQVRIFTRTYIILNILEWGCIVILKK